MSGRPHIFTWHVHGSYLYYLSKSNLLISIPKKNGLPGYGGRAGPFRWGENIVEIPAEDVRHAEFDSILYQGKDSYKDRKTLFTSSQLSLPQLFLEHDPPREHPTDTAHIVKDRNTLVVHVSFFNELMWDTHAPHTVIEHGIEDRGYTYTGELPRGIVVVNDLSSRGRRLGLDVFQKAREEVPLDLIGMRSTAIGGFGEVPMGDMPPFLGRYRFFFSPIRYTSLGLSIIEAMMAGLPILGLRTTELADVIDNGKNGFLSTNVENVIRMMKLLIADGALARAMGEAARKTALERFNIHRFSADWEKTISRWIHAKRGTTFTRTSVQDPHSLRKEI